LGIIPFIQGKRKITDGIVILCCKNYFFLINLAIFEAKQVFFKMGSGSSNTSTMVYHS
jgi:hypothetical protein